MPPPKKQAEEPEDESWMTVYADAITVLMAFFVMLLSFTKYDIPAFEELKEALAENVGGREPEATTTQLLKIDIENVVFEMQADQAVEVGQDDEGVFFELNGNAFFRPGTAELNPQAIPVLQKIADTIASPRYDPYNIKTQGHTDDVPINSIAFPSNWELSTARASTVVRLFIGRELDDFRMEANGFAHTQPKFPNTDSEGAPIPENRAANRRVVIRVNPMSFEEREEFFALQEARELAEAIARRRAEDAAQKAAAGANGQALPAPDSTAQ